MKKIIYVLLALTLLFVPACSANSDSASNPLSDNPPNSPPSNQSGVLDGMMAILPIDYNTVQALISDVAGGIKNDRLAEIEEDEALSKKGTFRNFVSGLRNDGYLYVPRYQGKELTFRNQEGFSNISLFPSELYQKPWIFYYPDKEQTGILYISMMKLDANIRAQANQQGAPWLMAALNPNGAQSNADPYPLYSTVSEKAVKLQDRTVTARVGQLKDDPRTYLYFVYDDVLVKVVVTSDAQATKWLQGFSVERVSLR